MSFKHAAFLSLIFFLTGCAALLSSSLDELYGAPHPRERTVAYNQPLGENFNQKIKPILENRCTVCHGCYDAPCQLKMSSTTGIQRGASKELVYDGLRLTASSPSRLFVDHDTIEEWREAEFHPVLNERLQSVNANLEGSLIFKMLELKKQHPANTQALLPSDITVNIDRDYQCPKIEEFDSFAQKHANWGMPYGLPPLSSQEHNAIISWLANGAPLPDEPPLPSELHIKIHQWEQFFNQTPLKNQLVSRYIYEHLFLGALYFDEVSSEHFFKLVRSTTPPGKPIKIIASRRPYDSPNTDEFYYRLQHSVSTRLDKTHMPYALNEKRLNDWEKWFLNDSYQVTSLPSYDPMVAGNPFIAFEQIPPQSRYRFMLEEAEFTIMGFIKGPVCRGQVALNVIRDRFWVYFMSPDLVDPEAASKFLASQGAHLRLPTETGSTLRPISNWVKYSSLHKNYLKAQYEANKRFVEKNHISLDEKIIWDGDGKNPNAALTVFRHFDSASVVKGLVGTKPKTAWIINYPILERIHYLLVAGFDVYGNVGHQLITRLYMDFLRMESEMNFLSLLPAQNQEAQWAEWYRGADSASRNFVNEGSRNYFKPTDITYKTDTPLNELYDRLQQHLAPVIDTSHYPEKAKLTADIKHNLQLLGNVSGLAAAQLPQAVILFLEDDQGQVQLFSVLHNNAHTNITSLLKESSNRIPEEDSVTVAKGLISSYPGAFWYTTHNQLPLLVRDAQAIKNDRDYELFMSRHGIRRTNPNFWAYSDQLHKLNRQTNPITAGLYDLSRLENR
ncbi:fatty acid cis/trans isomerase [Aestuariicella hydrocarbonica]|uniref:Fatty acid cis/trans isomerase n=1 Tax=Pseudomaricurvus hydrocarbonicus TaxID=1470433 RepID=A0A9E5JVB4_9GAMM|nr:fatty acid cis/trans isomerase [Aestuariicella hydrocarbonica]NHO65231.1 fatty acid cis/trans isomerase [Aestuariicella hydrocarbonica]